jgi:protein phosphatase
MKSFGLTDKGKVRADNQDCFLLELCPEKDCLIAVLCDGMGGAKAGGLASHLSNRAFTSRVYEGLRGAKGKDINYRNLLQKACGEANGVSFEYSHFSEEYRGMGTTLVGGVIKSNGSGYIINVGDSRAYLLSPRKGSIRQITRYHSLVAELMRFGAITAEEAKVHPQRSIITRALGTEESVDADYFEFRLKGGELLLLCSDGLSNTLSDAEILAQAKTCREPQSLCRRLIDLTLERGARDNVTVVAVSK